MVCEILSSSQLEICTFAVCICRWELDELVPAIWMCLASYTTGRILLQYIDVEGIHWDSSPWLLCNPMFEVPMECKLPALRFRFLEALKGRRDVHFELPEEPNFSDPDTSASRLSCVIAAQAVVPRKRQETPKSKPIFSTALLGVLSWGAPISSMKVHLLPESRLGISGNATGNAFLSDTFRLCCGSLRNLMNPMHIWYSVWQRLHS